MMILAPSILAADFKELGKKIGQSKKMGLNICILM